MVAANVSLFLLILKAAEYYKSMWCEYGGNFALWTPLGLLSQSPSGISLRFRDWYIGKGLDISGG